jgi:phosphoglycolate phosphatase-like HAD superfamily hydrolase
MDLRNELKDLSPLHDFFVGIDSDGCVFDTMEVKQKEFFIPNALKHFDLYPVSKILSETWEFVNLYSIHRGGNRFTSILKVFELLSERKEIKDSGLNLPDMTELDKWTKSETKLGNETLRKYLESNYDPGLEKVLRWSEEVNKEISLLLRKIPPFPYALNAIKDISSFADMVIVSQTPLEALEREWEEHDLKRYAKAIAGQEHGTKTEHIALAAKGKYVQSRILMIGDARGDMDAAKNNGILFYPIIPGKEDMAWKRLIEEGIEKFVNGTFSGAYENNLIKEFLLSLPVTPPWE